MTYPNEFLRGVINSTDEFVTKYGYLTKNAFRIDKYDPDLRENDGFCEISITWYDCEDAVNILKNQVNERKGTQQFQGGFCKVNRTKMELLFQTYSDDGYFDYERCPMEATEKNQANPYHGNLLVKDCLPDSVRLSIQASLATLAGKVLNWEE